MTQRDRELALDELDAVSGGGKLESLDDLSSNAQTQLQTSMSNQAKAEATLSNITKSVHDTTSGVIGKI
jgi:hypothetical protein